MAKKEHAVAAEPKRYYYKAKAGNGFLNFKSPLPTNELVGYEEITAEEFERLTYVEPHVPTEQEKAIAAKKQRIGYLKGELAKTDYVALKLAEGETTKTGEYKSVFASRKAWRAEINELEAEIDALCQPKQGDEVPEPTDTEPDQEVVEGETAEPTDTPLEGGLGIPSNEPTESEGE